MRTVRLLILIVVFALIAGACSTSGDDETTTTPAETTTTTPAETTAPPDSGTTGDLSNTNPPPADPPPPIWSMPGELAHLTGLDRCQSNDQSGFVDADDCETAATEISDQVDDLLNAPPTDPFSEVIGDKVLVKRDGHHLCFIDADEIVTPAEHEDVVSVLLEVGLISSDTEIVDIGRPEEDPLPAGLHPFAHVPTAGDADPIGITRALLDSGIPASPRYVVLPSPRWRFGPGGTPLPADPDVAPAQGSLATTATQSIAIVDTGIPASNPLGDTWDVVLNLDSWEAEPTNLDLSIKGHGLFIAGIIRRLLPRAAISVVTPLPSTATSGLFDEHAVVAAIGRAIDGNQGADVVNLSLGTYACEPDMVPLEMAGVFGLNPGITFVAAAGNDSHGPNDDPFWPAGFADPVLFGDILASSGYPANFPSDLQSAFSALLDQPNVIGVGALVDTADAGWLPVWFSNQVAATTWAPGANIVSNYPGWQGFAQWDGTSFAAPHITALVATGWSP